MTDVNIHTISGRLGKDAETVSVSEDKEAVRLSVACSEYRGKTDEGKSRIVTNWFDVTTFIHGEFAGKLKKGDKILVSGTHRVDSSEDGKKYHKIIADRIELLASNTKTSADE